MLAITIVLFVVPHNQQIVTIRQFFTYRISLFRNQNLNIQKKHIALDVLLTAGFVYVLKKRGAPESLPLIRPSTQPHTSVEKKPARAFYHLRLWIYLLF